MALTDNLISYWKLDGNSTDEKGANNGTDTAITYSATGALIVQRAGYNGTSSTIKTGTTGMVTGAGARTINGWIYKTTTAIDIFAGSTDGTANGTFGLYVNNLRLTAWGSTDSDTGLDLTLNAWHMITVVYDGTNKKVYLDAGAPYSAAKTVNTVYDASGFHLGSNSGGANWLHGNLDECGYWSRELTSTEITRLYNSGAGLAYSSFPDVSGSPIFFGNTAIA